MEGGSKGNWMALGLIRTFSLLLETLGDAPRGGTQHMHIRGGGVSPRNFQTTQKYHFSLTATQKYQLILYLEACT